MLVLSVCRDAGVVAEERLTAVKGLEKGVPSSVFSCI